MVDKKKRASKKRTIAKPDSVEELEGKLMHPVADGRVVGVLHHHEGPLPPAKDFADYKKGHPDAPERILRFMEKDQEQSHKERDSVHKHLQSQDVAESRRKDKAQWFGFVLSLVIMGAATAVALFTDERWLSVLLVFMALPLLIDRFFERLLALFTKNKDEKK